MSLTQHFNLDNIRRLLGLLLFDVVWFSAVVGRNEWLAATLVLVLAQITVAWKGGVFATAKHWALFVLLLLAGLALEGTVIALDVIRFTDGPMPLWLVLLWLGFVAMLINTLDGLTGRWGWAALLGIVSGPITYAAGVRLGAAELLQAEWLMWVLYSVLWAAYMIFFAVAMKSIGGETSEQIKTS